MDARRHLVGWVWGIVGLGLSVASAAAEKPPLQNAAAPPKPKAPATVTHRDATYGFSIGVPEDWTVYPAQQAVTLRPLGFRFASKDMGWKGPGVTVMQYPAETGWIAVNPRVRVEVYELKAPLTNAQAMDALVAQLQQDPDAEPRLSFGPASVELQGVAWAKSAWYLKNRINTTEARRVDAYEEFYVRADGSRLWLVEMMCEPTALSTLCKDAATIAQSMTVAAREPQSTPFTKPFTGPPPAVPVTPPLPLPQAPMGGTSQPASVKHAATTPAQSTAATTPPASSGTSAAPSPRKKPTWWPW